MFLRYNDVPSGFQYDAIYQNALQADRTAVIPATKPGDYYILIRGDQEPAADTPVTITTQLLPLAITNVTPDGDPITYSAANLPLGASLNDKTGLFSWTPAYFTDYPGIVFTASDGNLSSQETVTLHVARVDRPPVIDPLAPQSGREGADVSFTLIAGDPDGDPVVYSALSALPAGSFFNRTTGLFDWTPNYGQAGQYTLHFGATDPGGNQATIAVSGPAHRA